MGTLFCNGLLAQGRFALVIGNGAYSSVSPLKNPVNDADDIAVSLKTLGFEVDLLKNASLGDMESAVVRLGNQLGQSKGAYGFFFYAGHGVQSNGVNYLIPVDADIKGESFLKTKALAAQAVLDTLQESRNALNVVVLDACRDNPFGWARSGNRGLSVVANQPAGSVIAYATSVGSIAQDGTGRNGLFTSQLLKHLGTAGLEIKDVFNRTGADVKKVSGNLQIPAVYNQFFDSAYLAGNAVSNGPPSSEPAFGFLSVPPGSLKISTSTGGTLTLLGRTLNLPANATLPVDQVAPGDYPATMIYPDGQIENKTFTVTSGQTVVVGFSYVQAPLKPKTSEGFIFVLGGTFSMGSTMGNSDEKPVHRVTVSSFYLSATEVTQAQYKMVMGTNPSRFKGDELPVESVTWFDAVTYCNKLSILEKRTPAYVINGTNVTWNKSNNGYRLPTEAEWEYAARGGNQSDDNLFAGSGNSDEVAWCNGNSGGQTRPVGTKKPNELGLFDVSGNVWEWVWDKKGSYSNKAQTDPPGPSAGLYQVFRGGSWYDSSIDARSSSRGYNNPSSGSSACGFRVVLPTL